MAVGLGAVAGHHLGSIERQRRRRARGGGDPEQLGVRLAEIRAPLVVLSTMSPSCGTECHTRGSGTTATRNQCRDGPDTARRVVVSTRHPIVAYRGEAIGV